MAHRADQIIEAIAALVRARVEGPLGCKVYTHRRLSLDPEQDEIPAISVDFGEDTPAVQSIGFIDSILTVPVTAIAREPTEPELREKLLELRREVHIAILADVKLGLPSFVIQAAYGGAEAPDVDVSGDMTAGTLTSNWLVHYRMNFTDPGD